MTTFRTLSLATGGALFALALPALAAPDQTGGRKLSTTLTGATEVPGPGDPDGRGMFSATVNAGQGQVCYTLTATMIDPATAAHIHEAPAGRAGPVVTTLEAPTDGSSEACATVTRELAMELIKRPQDYYINVHNPAFPAGAIRGQLAK
jgi:hypothetical protein